MIKKNLDKLNAAAHTGTIDELYDTCHMVQDDFQKWLYQTIRSYEKRNGNELLKLGQWVEVPSGPHACPFCSRIHEPLYWHFFCVIWLY